MCSGGLVGCLALVDGQQVHLVSKRECVNPNQCLAQVDLLDVLHLRTPPCTQWLGRGKADYMNDGVGTKQNLLIAHGGLEGGKQLIGRVETKQKRFFQLSNDIKKIV